MRKSGLIVVLLLLFARVAIPQSLPNPLGWMIAGTPVANQPYLFTATAAMTIPANFAGAQSRCTTAPSVAQTYAIWDFPSGGANSQIGTATLATNCNTTAGATFTTTGGAAKSVAAGDALTLVAPATINGEAGVGITFVPSQPLALTGSGFVRSGTPVTTTELSGDVTTVSSSVATVTGINGAAVPTSATLLGSNASKQLTAASTTMGGDLSGSFPNPTVTQLNGAAVPVSAPLLGSTATRQLTATSTGMGGDLSGAFPNPVVNKVNGLAVPVSASLLGSNGSGQLTSTSTTMGGDLSGTFPNPTVAQIAGGAIPTSAPLLGTNASKQPVAVAVGTGLTLAGGTLTATSGPAGQAPVVIVAPAVCDNVTNDAPIIQSTINGAAPGSEVDLPAGKQYCKINSGISITTNVGFDTKGATLVSSGLTTNGSAAFTIVSASPGSNYAGNRVAYRRINLAGPGSSGDPNWGTAGSGHSNAGTIGLMLTASNISIEGLNISGYNQAWTVGAHGYGISIFDPQIYANYWGIFVPYPPGTNSGENINFTGGSIFNNTVGVENNDGGTDLSFNHMSFDYNTTHFHAYGGSIFIGSNTHIEGFPGPNPPFVLGSGGYNNYSHLIVRDSNIVWGSSGSGSLALVSTSQTGGHYVHFDNLFLSGFSQALTPFSGWCSGTGCASVDMCHMTDTFVSATAHNNLGPFGSCQAVDTAVAFSNNTTGNASTAMHGFLPQLSGVATNYLNGTGGWTTPAASGGGGATYNMPSGDGKAALDGATGANLPVTGTNAASTTTATAPAVTTYANGDVILSITGNASVTGPTQIVAANQTASYLLWAGYQTQTTAGAFAARTGTQGSGDAFGMTIALVPVAGQTPAYTLATPSAGNGGVAASGTLTYTWGATPANGTLLLMCETFYSTSGASGTFLNSFVLLPAAQLTTNHQGGGCYYHWAYNEPTSYTVVAPSGTGVTAFIMAITNAAALDMPVTSASAAFVSGDVGKDFALQNAATGGAGQLDGTIQAVASATTVYPSFLPVASISGAEYVYCTDHTTNWVTTMPAALSSNGGGSVSMPGVPDCFNGNQNGNGQASIVWPIKIPIRLYGQAAGIQWSSANTHQGGPPSFAAGFTNTWGSMLIDMSTGSALPAMQLGTNGYDSCLAQQVNLTIENFTLWGGVGYNRDGGGADGIKIVNAIAPVFKSVHIGNFVGHPANMYTDTTTSIVCAYGYGVSAQNSSFTFGNASGFIFECHFTSGSGGPLNQNGYLVNNTFEANGASGLEFKNCSKHGGFSNGTFWSVVLQGNVFQRNWVGAGGCTNTTCFQLLNNNTSITGGVVDGNYFEDDSGKVGASNQSFGWSFTRWGNQTFVGGVFRAIFNTASNPLESDAGTLGNGTYSTPVCTSDATSATAGATYAGGGSNKQLVQYNGANWIVQGSTLGCN